MNQKNVRKFVIALIIVLILACLGFYIYDIVVNNRPYQDNLFKIILAVALLIASIFRMFRGNNRANLDFYEKAYAKELGSAFAHTPALRKKLVSATRYYDESNYNNALKLLFKLAKESKAKTTLCLYCFSLLFAILMQDLQITP